MKRQAFIIVLAGIGVSLGAAALTGSGDSAEGPLETVRPTLDAISVPSEASIEATFSEPMLEPDVSTPGNYAVSGLGAGTLGEHPDSVSGSGPYTLTWATGEMQDGQMVTLTATAVQDAVGNPIDPAANSASAAGVGVAPIFTGLIADPGQASAGETVSISFSSSEDLDGNPIVTVNTNPATFVSGTKATSFTYEYLVLHTDPLGAAAIAVSGSDLAGNLGSLSDSAALEIVEPEPELPLRWLPAALALLLAGMAVLAHRKRGLTQAKRGTSGDVSVPAFWFLLLAAMLLAPAALAQAPSVSNVTFVQQDNGAGGTEVVITYDLDAPNGPCDITVSLSKDGGLDGFAFAVTSVTGDLTGVATGAGHTIVWQIATDYPNETIAQAQIWVTASDGLGEPEVASFALDNGAATNTSGTVTLDNTATESPTEYLASENPLLSGATWQTYAAAPSFALSSGGGTKTVYFKVRNAAGESGVVSDSIERIATPSVTTFALNNGAATTTSGTVTLNNACANGPAHYLASEDPGFAGATWKTYAAAPSFALSSGGGTKTVYFKVRNAAGESGVVSDDIDRVVPPTVTAFDLDGGAASTTTGAVTLDNTATDDPTEYLASEQPDFSGATWQAYAAAPSFTLSGGAGTKTVHFKVRNAAGESLPMSDTIELVVAPTLSTFAIEGGAANAYIRTVTLDNTVADTPTEYLASEDAGFTGATWHPYAGAPLFTLSAGTGTKTVYLKVRNAAGESGTLSDTIDLALDIELMPVAAGDFDMGSTSQPDEEPIHTVTLSAYRIGKYEVTKAQFVAIYEWAEGQGYLDDSTPDWLDAYSEHVLYTGPGVEITYSGGVFSIPLREGQVMDDHPVHQTRWYGAVAFCNWLSELAGLPPCYDTATWERVSPLPDGFRLPTEAEWERAAAWDGSYHWQYGCTSDTISWSRACYDNLNLLGFSGPPYTLPVGYFDGVNGGTIDSPSPVGCYDMSGNANEMCHDWYAADYYSTGGPPWVDPAGPATGSERVIRGGQWSNPEADIRTASRQHGNGGFRVVRSSLLPIVTSFVLDGDALTAGDSLVTLDNVCAYSPTEYMASEDPAFAGASWHPYATAPTFTLSSATGPKTVYFKVRNGWGESTAVSDTIDLVGAPPTVTWFALDNGAASSAGPDVTLNNVCSGVPQEYMASEQSDFSGAAWQTYAAAPSFALSGTLGTKTVYFKTRNAAGESLPVNDTIDRVAPPVPQITSFAINAGAATTASLDVTLDNTCIDLNDPAEYLASEDPGFSGATWQPYDTAPGFTLSSGLGAKTIYLKVRNLGGESGVASDSIDMSLCEMVPVAGGPFEMGDPWAEGGADELPVHTVYLSPYLVGKYELTNAECVAVLEWALAQGYIDNVTADTVEAYGEEIVDLDHEFCQIAYTGSGFEVETHEVYPMDDHPAMGLSVDGMIVWCNWLSEMSGLTPCYSLDPWGLITPMPDGYRLPAEAEWERAAAWDTAIGGRHWRYGFTSDTFGTNRCNGIRSNPLGFSSEPYTTPVGYYNGINPGTMDSPSPVGCYDMSGNANEMTYGAYQPDYYTTGGPPWVDPMGPSPGLSGRGASWAHYPGYEARYRTALRNEAGSNGLRIARNDPNAAAEVIDFALDDGAATTVRPTVTLDNGSLGWPTEYMASEAPDFSGASWQPYDTAPEFTLSTGLGVKTVYFKTRNAVGESPAVSDTIERLEEPDPPKIAYVQINWGAPATTDPHVYILVYLESYSGPVEEYRIRQDTGDWSDWMPYSGSPFYDLWGGYGTKWLTVEVRNYSGSDSASDSIEYAAAAPPHVTWFSILGSTGNSMNTVDPEVTLHNICMENPTEYLASQAPDFSGATWQPYTTSAPFTLTGTPGGVETVYFKTRNAAGESTVANAEIAWLAGPLPVITSFVIDGDAATTVDLEVTLDSVCEESPTEYLASEDPGFVGASWLPYDPAALFMVSTGIGTKTVYFKVRNANGESDPTSDAITYAPAPPEMIAVASDTFTMGRRDDGDDGTYGQADELPRHDVTLSAYEIGKYEITNQQVCDVYNWANAQGYFTSVMLQRPSRTGTPCSTWSQASATSNTPVGNLCP